MNKKSKKKNRGFSLVELIIVIAIMAILAGVLTPQFVKYLNNSKKSADIQTAQSIATVVSTMYTDDAVAGGTPKIVTGTITAIAGSAVATELGSTPVSKVDSSGVYYYQMTTAGAVTIYIQGTGDASPVQVYPTATGRWL